MYHQTFFGSFLTLTLYFQHPSRIVPRISCRWFSHPLLHRSPSPSKSFLLVGFASLSRSPASSRTTLFMTVPIP